MGTLTVECVRRPDGSRKGRNGAYVVLLGPQSMSLPGGISTIQNAPPSDLGAYTFGFWSVTGAAAGAFVTLNTAAQFTTGNGDMVARAWFVAKEPKPPQGNEMYVDAFDVEKGLFLDDDFVAVKDSNNMVNAQLTQDANTNGLVPTTSIEFVEASSWVGFVKLGKWECVNGQEMINGGTVTAAQDSNADAVAFYTVSDTAPFPGSPTSSPWGKFGHMFEAQTWVSWGVTVDGGGPTGKGPVPPWEPLTRDFAAGLALAQAAYKVNARLRGDALKIAAKQISLAADAITKEIEAAASGKK